MSPDPPDPSHGFRLKLLIISAIIVICLSVIDTSNGSPVDSQIITEPEPGQEYVFVQTSQSGARPIKRKDKKTVSESKIEDSERFETGHKIPTFLTFQEKENVEKTKVKRAAVDIPGAIKIDASKLIEKYRDILESTTKQTTDVDSTTTNIVLTTGGPATKRSLEIIHSKNKKGGILEAGSVDSDAKLTGSGSDKQTSRIQIKKGPNGQDYEYEYVYYYYDEDEPSPGKELSKTKEEKITNAHDGPARNSIAPSTSRGNSNKNRYQTIDRSNSNSPNLNAEPASNEVVPTTSKSQSKSRGRQVPSDEDVISEERLPPNTRFPPRSRNLSTTPSSTSTATEVSEEHKPPHIRSRQRGRPAVVQEQTEEPATVPSQQTSRQRTRPNVKRPSLELVDSASFKTHASDASVSQYKELSASRDELNQAKLLGESDAQTATSRSFDTADDVPRAQSLDDDDRERFDSKEEKLFDSSTTENAIISTTLTDDEMTAAMDKVALDLYAILQGTQNMIQEDDTSSTDNSDSPTTELGNSATEEGSYSTTELLTEEPTTPSTTTTTTTTTQATTTTTTTEPSTPPLPGRGRFRGRTTASSRFRQSTSTSTTEASNDVTSKGSRFSPGRTSFGGRNRINARTTSEKPIESEITKESASANNNARPSIGGNRSRFGSTRGRGSTTTTTVAPNSDSSNSVSSPVRPSLTRPRPNFNLRRRGGPSSTTEASTSTAKSGDAEESSTEAPESSSTTVRSVRPRISGSARPLRPGPRININSRGRIGAVTTTPSSTTAAIVSDDNEKVASEEVSNVESESNESGETTPTSTTTENALQRLRNRARISVNANKPKAPAPAPVVRRTNPLLSRRKPIGVQAESTTEGHSSEESSSEDKVQNEVTENPLIEEANSEQPVEISSVSSTTEARGLNGLLAGRRRLNRRPGTIL
ncbi:flocculation protein FLO11 [Chrysoperla carnea]|uniref:flocculation protein FLO11 n=1 Tax=Chrysoperla carnea TaxID=189513 RepID=UPI001D066A4E|nr:flocculation protein FLO11 [Chrysoperla carnea]